MVLIKFFENIIAVKTILYNLYLCKYIPHYEIFFIIILNPFLPPLEKTGFYSLFSGSYKSKLSVAIWYKYCGSHKKSKNRCHKSYR